MTRGLHRGCISVGSVPPVIKAVCFDFDGTLAHFAGDFAELVDGLRKDLGLTPEDAERLALVRAQVERRGGPMTFADTVRAALTDLELPVPDDLEALAAQVVRKYNAQMALLPGAEEALELCRVHRLPLALVTNGPADMQRAAVRGVGLESHFKRLVISGDAAVGVRKPDPRIFGLACDALGSRPAETVMVGDNLEADVLGALSAGMQAVFLGSVTRPDCVTLLNIQAFGTFLQERL